MISPDRLADIIVSSEKAMHPLNLNGKSLDVSNLPFRITASLIENLGDKFIRSEELTKLASFEGQPIAEVVKKIKSSSPASKMFSNLQGDVVKISECSQNPSFNIHDKVKNYVKEEVKKHRAMGEYGMSFFHDDDMLAGVGIKLGEKGLNFQAHGIAKGNVMGQFEQLDKLLTNGIDPKKTFYSAPLDVPSDMVGLLGAAFGTGGGTAYHDGAFILVAEKGKDFVESGIRYVIVNKSMLPMLDEFKKAYPKYTFVGINEVNEFFSKL